MAQITKPEMGMWHLVAGSTGAGKTTHARALAERLGGVCFSIDEWMNLLFWPDCPQKNDLPWALDRVARCEAQSASVARQLAVRGVAAVLDMGLTTATQRGAWLGRAEAAGVPVALHLLELPPDVRWQRVEARNAEAAGTFAFAVTRAMFDQVERLWEPPDVAECSRYTILYRLTGASAEAPAPY